MHRDRGTEVVEAAVREVPAAIILEVELPGLDGYEVCRELRERFGPALPIIFTSGERTDALDQAAGLLLGADDYVTKPVEPAELIARVRRLVERPRANGHAGTSDRFPALTGREREVLELLGEGYRQDEIAARLVISPKTVATHIQHVLAKLDVRSSAQAVALVLRDKERDALGPNGV